MKDGKIYIIVTDKLPGGVGPEPTPTPTPEEKNSSELLKHWARNKVLSELKKLAVTATQYSINNIGNFTGNYQTQMEVQESLSLLTSSASIGMAALAGFTATGGNPIGAAIGASIAVLNLGAQFGQNIYSQYMNQKRVNYEISQLQRRSGLNQYIDGNRGTEN